jgi:hypothetical protein
MDRYPNPAGPADELQQRRDDQATPTCTVAECTCPEFCERDHANE